MKMMNRNIPHKLMKMKEDDAAHDDPPAEDELDKSSLPDETTDSHTPNSTSADAPASNLMHPCVLP